MMNKCTLEGFNYAEELVGIFIFYLNYFHFLSSRKVKKFIVKWSKISSYKTFRNKRFLLSSRTSCKASKIEETTHNMYIEQEKTLSATKAVKCLDNLLQSRKMVFNSSRYCTYSHFISSKNKKRKIAFFLHFQDNKSLHKKSSEGQFLFKTDFAITTQFQR